MLLCMLLPFTAPKLHTITKDTFRYLFESWIHLDTLLPLFVQICFD
jgi:negative regulator of sigma E activity